MNENAIEIMNWLKPHTMTATLDDMDRVDEYIAFDRGQRSGGRRVRPTQSPEFEVGITAPVNGALRSAVCTAVIVACDVPHKDGTKNIGPGTAIAVAQVEWNDDFWYMLISTSTDNRGEDLRISSVLIQCEEEPEQILRASNVFELVSL